MKEFRRALTFDDILLVPKYSELVPSDICTDIHFARDVRLRMPILSSAMDTVTESKIAIVMAQNGGAGVIHKNMSIDSQVLEVEKVKKYESGLILDPITLDPKQPVSKALKLMKQYAISGVPITVEGKLVGILTNRDLRFETNIDQTIETLMTKENLVTAHAGITLLEAKEILQKNRIEKLPVVDKKGMLKGLITIKDIEKAQAFPQATKDAHGRLFVGAAVGVSDQSIERVEALIASGVDMVVVDTAHGHSKNVLDIIEVVSKKHPEVIIVGGNVVTAEATEALIKKGVDVVKVGLGPGSICTTRVVAGVGVPQITAIVDCCTVARKYKKSVIADGGIKFSGDIVKALALGADTVMVGNLLAGTDESPGEMILYQGRAYKVYRGMGSLGAMIKGSKDRYLQSDVSEFDKFIPEGIEGRVPYKGSASGVLHQLLGGLKSGMGYLGASSVSDLQSRADFVQVSPFGLQESHVHDVNITKEAPNYRLD